MSIQIDSLIGRIAQLEQELGTARQIADEVRQHTLCSRRSPDFPLQPHGPTKYCHICYEALRLDHARATVVLSSIRSVVQERMSRGEGCPFCTGTRKHTDVCYLGGDAGVQILDEYRAIEQHRDLLLAERSRERAPHGPAPTIPRVGLKGRIHRADSAG